MTTKLFETVTPERRQLMARVRGKDTKPELRVRRVAHAMGYRFRLHRRNLPGSPDLVFPRLRKVVFVHGCFWHRHEGCPKSTTPKARAVYWQNKFRENVTRDKRSVLDLQALGWRVLIIWECETNDDEFLRSRLSNFLAE
ncbi:very short patch repair endonuclease [Methylocystis sp. JR02]|uniref:very short patch repair endonuclease n=1 Tax=Methylocystis sp. JR02 TaxID=3046284 RepID=UPI0024BAFA2E|nr:very short patch repair endonuclease [Methylocystis sp. JR02]MDJ0449265.1 very short patch repair endonuclease [Methylocystis sp. JR02]